MTDWTTAFSPATASVEEQDQWVQDVAAYLQQHGATVVFGRATKLETPGLAESLYIYALVLEGETITFYSLNQTAESIRHLLPAWLVAILDWHFQPQPAP